MVFTTSKIVELLLNNRTISFPLYSFLADYPEGHALCFTIEAEGELTFDEGSEVKLIELYAFRTFHWDPTSYGILIPSDSLIYTVTETLAANSVDAGITEVVVSHTSFSGPKNTRFRINPPLSFDDYAAATETYLSTGAQWRGPFGYPNFFKIGDE